MGGYGFYVWSSYAAMGLAILLEVAMLRSRRKDSLRRLRRLQRWEGPADDAHSANGSTAP